MATSLHFVADTAVCPSCGSHAKPGDVHCCACAGAIRDGKPVRVGAALLLSNLRLAKADNPTKE